MTSLMARDYRPADAEQLQIDAAGIGAVGAAWFPGRLPEHADKFNFMVDLRKV